MVEMCVCVIYLYIYREREREEEGRREGYGVIAKAAINKLTFSFFYVILPKGTNFFN